MTNNVSILDIPEQCSQPVLAAAKINKISKWFDAKLLVRRSRQTVDASRVMDLLTMCTAGKGEKKITVIALGPEAENAISAVKQSFTDKSL